MIVCVFALVPMFVKLFNERNSNHLLDWYFFLFGGGKYFVRNCHEQFDKSGRVLCKFCPVKIVLLDDLTDKLGKNFIVIMIPEIHFTN